ncbi:hypothetical protein HQ576_20490 [bacterium]|nr:hypothetical protein [bacterium]
MDRFRTHAVLLLVLACCIPLPGWAAEAPPVVPDHHTVGDVTYTDRNGDGVVDHVAQRAPDGSALVKHDADLDGTYDRQHVRQPDGTTADVRTIAEPAPKMADVRAGTAAPWEWHIFGFPAWKVLGALGSVAVVVLAVLYGLVRLWRRGKRVTRDA